ncbi:unnamed protein product [Meloidogyne enterolobii]|uniref:Uncharacterized protein n=1 Tax=Meloidogyne enterolobii TaxID=390850 RepID=A0ACB0YL21_MELEN
MIFLNSQDKIIFVNFTLIFFKKFANRKEVKGTVQPTLLLIGVLPFSIFVSNKYGNRVQWEMVGWLERRKTGQKEFGKECKRRLQQKKFTAIF